MRATIDWSVEPAPRRRSATCSRTSASSRRGSPSKRSRRSAPAARGTARRSTRSARSSTARSSSRPTSTGASVVLAARDRARVRARSGSRRAATRTAMRAAHADYYAGLVARLAPGLRGTGTGRCRAAARARAAEPPRRGAPPRLHRPARRRRRLRLEPAHLLVDRRASSPRCALWMLELLGKQQPITPHTRAVACVLRAVGRDVAAPIGSGGRRPRRVRPAVHRERRRGCRRDGDRRARRRRACSSPTSTCRPRQAELQRGGRRRSARSATRGARPSPRSSLGRLALAARRASPRRSQHFDRATGDRAGRAGPVHAGGRGQPASRAELPRAATSTRPRRSSGSTLRLAARLHYEEGIAYGLEGHVRRRRRARRRVAGRRAVGRGGAIVRQRIGRLRRRGVHRARAAASRRCASATRRAWRPASAPAPT